MLFARYVPYLPVLIIVFQCAQIYLIQPALAVPTFVVIDCTVNPRYVRATIVAKMKVSLLLKVSLYSFNCPVIERFWNISRSRIIKMIIRNLRYFNFKPSFKLKWQRAQGVLQITNFSGHMKVTILYIRGW